MRKGVGPAQGAHRDVLRSPGADAGQRLQRGQRVLDGRGGMERQAAFMHFTRKRHDGPRPRTDHAQHRDLARVERGDTRRFG